MASVFARIDASPSSLNLPFVAVLFFPKPSLHRNPLLPIFLAFISILILVGNLRRNDDSDAAAEMTGDVEQCSDGGDELGDCMRRCTVLESSITLVIKQPTWCLALSARSPGLNTWGRLLRGFCTGVINTTTSATFRS
nr:hypothetical protein Iba_chr04bCG15120 [Ipomoea batatas]